MTDDRSLLAAVLPALLAVGMIFLITGASLATLPLYRNGMLSPIAFEREQKLKLQGD